MDFAKYIDAFDKPEEFCDTGLDKNIYLDIMDLALDAYSIEHLQQMTDSYRDSIVEDIHAFSRLTAALGLLIAKGRRGEHKELWISMMDCCYRDMHRITGNMKLDFTTKEIMPVYKAMSPYVDDAKKKHWLDDLEKIRPYENYRATLDFLPPEKLHNINIFNMVGEYLRQTEGLTDTTEYFQRHWPVQLEKFDANGMYREPHTPILYDVAVRYSLELMFHFGYDGEFAGKLDKYMEKAAYFTLFMQSSNFELPYGGRSNQFLFGEAYVAGVCEYEARRYKAKGDMKTAGMFKRCARLTMGSVMRWIKETYPPKHNRNFYPVESNHGEECYAYYDKYMITLAVNSYLAFLYADDSIDEYPCPQECGGYVFETSEDFHKIFACCKGNFIQIDTCGDPHYDSTGFGRYHKAGVPSELGISVPFAKHPEYKVSEGLCTDSVSLSIGWDTGEGQIQYLSDISEVICHKLEVVECSDSVVRFNVTYTGEGIKGCSALVEKYTLDENGVCVTSEAVDAAVDKIYCKVPVFRSNGKDEGSITDISNSTLSVRMNDCVYSVATDGCIKLSHRTIANRNGEYYIADVVKTGNNSLELKLSLYTNS